jgi:transposase
VSGIKRHIAVDTQGLPHAIHITTADVTDRDGAIEMIFGHQQTLNRVKNLLVDGSYSGEQFASNVQEIIASKV